MNSVQKLTEKQIKKVPDIKPGDTVRVHTKIIEGSKERIQVFEGVVIRVKGSGISQTFTVRKLSYGIGVERTFLIQSPKLAKIEVKKRSKVRRAYLTYLRGLRGKAAKLKDVKFDALAVNTIEEELKPEDLAPATPAEDLDAEITELDVTEAEDAKDDTVVESTEEIAAEEVAEAKEGDLGNVEAAEADFQEAEVAEVEAGLEKAEADLEKDKSTEGSKEEKLAEDIKPDDLNDEDSEK